MGLYLFTPLNTWCPYSSLPLDSPPLTVDATYDIGAYRIPIRNHVSLTRHSCRVHVAASYTQFFRKHFVVRVTLDILNNKVVSVRSMCVDGSISSFVLLDYDRAAAVVDGEVIFFDLTVKIVCARLHQLENASSIVRLDGCSILAFSSSVALVIEINDDNSLVARQITQAVSSPVFCAYAQLFVTLYEDKVFVWDKNSLQKVSFEHGAQGKPSAVMLNDKWLVLHVHSSSSKLRVYDAQYYRLQREISFRPNQPARIRVRLVGDLVVWNDVQYDEHNMSYLAFGMVDVTTGCFLWRGKYTSCLPVGSRVLPFEVLDDASILAQTSNFVFQQYRLPENLRRLVRSNLRQANRS